MARRKRFELLTLRFAGAPEAISTRFVALRGASLAHHLASRHALARRPQSVRFIARPEIDPPDRFLHGLTLQHRAIERQVGHDLLQPGILLLDLGHPLHLGRHHAGAFFFPPW